MTCALVNQIIQQLMKNSTNYYDLKKVRGIKVTKKPNFSNSIIYKEISSHLNEAAGKIKNNRQGKQTIVKDQKQQKEEQRLIASKKNSLNQLLKKTSKNDLTNLHIYGIYHKVSDNYMIETQQQTKLEPEDQKYLPYQRSKKQSKEITPNNSQLFKKITKSSKTPQELPENIKIEKNLFNYLYIIGKGGFGKVWKVEHKKTKNQYAMKEMLKSIVMTKKSVQSVMNQRVLLSQFNSPFIVNMHFAFQDRDTLYLVLDLMEGGDLRYHIGNRNFNEITSKFFIACIILGLEDLQANSIIHRDIKPENLVLDSRGYIRITDLGIARIYKPNNSCDTSGTPGYMSPEVICRMNHSFVSDYFALGVIAYELMTGRRPYNGRSRNQIRDLMLAKEIQLKFSEIPDDWSCEAADFINKLIKRKPQSRLGYNGISDIKNHPWLNGLNWEKLRMKDIQSPFIPMMKKNNFDQDEQITIEDEQQAQLIEKNSLLLRKPQFQQLFGSYYYSLLDVGQNDANTITIDAKDKQKKLPNKRVISGYRKSAQQQKEVKISDLMPQKKLSYNQSLPNKKKLDLIPQKNQKMYQINAQLLKEKKKSNQYQKNFFR